MTVRDNAGRILTSGNPVIAICGKRLGMKLSSQRKNAGREK